MLIRNPEWASLSDSYLSGFCFSNSDCANSSHTAGAIVVKIAWSPRRLTVEDNKRLAHPIINSHFSFHRVLLVPELTKRFSPVCQGKLNIMMFSYFLAEDVCIVRWKFYLPVVTFLYHNSSCDKQKNKATCLT